MRWGMVIDLKRCIGCYGCQLACKAEHGTPPGVYYARVLKAEEGQYPTVRNLFLPVLMRARPAPALNRRRTVSSTSIMICVSAAVPA
jgi:Fe-S-cluster-containing dehydrogenase component